METSNNYFLQKAMREQNLDFEEVKKDLLGTSQEKKPPQKS